MRRYHNLLHAFSTRRGGYSQSVFSSLNLGLSTADEKHIILQNRASYFSDLGISEDRLVIPKQVHSDNVRVVTCPGIYANCDALITREKNMYLTVQTADCFPVFLFDAVKEVCGLVHSGWRSTAQNIVGKTLKAMITHLKCDPANINSAIGPGVQQSCYQVDQKTSEYFPQNFLAPDITNHYLLNIQAVIVEQLKKSGVLDEQIEIDGRCTHCERDTFYSYRRDGAQSGRMMGVIGLKL